MADAHDLARRIDGLLAAGRAADALRLAEQGLASEPDDFGLLLRRARALSDLGRPDEARQACAEAIEAAPEEAAGHVLDAHLLADAGDHRRARQAVKTALSLEPDDASAHYFQAWLESAYGDPGTAARAADRVLALVPDTADAHHAQGLALRARKKWDDAEAAFRRGLTLDPENPHLMNDLGDLLVRRRRRREGIELLHAAAEADLESPIRRRAALARAPGVDEEGLGVIVLLAAGLALTFLSSWLFAWPWGWEEIDLMYKVGAAAFVLFAATHLVHVWRHRRLALPERTERFLKQADQEAGRLDTHTVLLSTVPVVYGVWLLILFSLVPDLVAGEAPPGSFWVVFPAVTLGLAALLPFVPGWLRPLPQIARRSLAWDLAAVSAGAPWVLLLLWLQTGTFELTSPAVAATLVVTTAGVLVAVPKAVRLMLELQRQRLDH